ncbi:MAG: hypothetical protein ACFFED_11340, partial [Candidatus Thorarchaeota archaeon]
MTRKVNYGTALRRYVKRYGLYEKLSSIINLLGNDAQSVFDWAEEEAKRNDSSAKNLGKDIFSLVGYEGAIRLVQENNRRGRITTKNEVKKRTGQ